MRIAGIGELLWDVFPGAERLGGAVFNFTAHARRLGHDVLFLSAVGDDARGRAARAEAVELGLPAEGIHTAECPTGTVTVQLDPEGKPAFTIHRPAAYDRLRLDGRDLERVAAFAPDYIAFGTLFQTGADNRALVRRVVEAAPGARRFYDVNLRPGSWDAALVRELLGRADVLKLNDEEAAEFDRTFGERHTGLEGFCRDWAERLGLKAMAVTRGAEGCAVLAAGEYAEAPGCAVEVADTVGAGDAFAAAFVHGLGMGWPARRIGEFANRLGALVTSRAGAVPRWTMEEVAALVTRG